MTAGPPDRSRKKNRVQYIFALFLQNSPWDISSRLGRAFVSHATLIMLNINDSSPNHRTVLESYPTCEGVMGRPISPFLQAKVLHRGQNNLPSPFLKCAVSVLYGLFWDHQFGTIVWSFGAILGPFWGHFGNHFGSGTLVRWECLGP